MIMRGGGSGEKAALIRGHPSAGRVWLRVVMRFRWPRLLLAFSSAQMLAVTSAEQRVHTRLSLGHLLAGGMVPRAYGKEH